MKVIALLPDAKTSLKVTEMFYRRMIVMVPSSSKVKKCSIPIIIHKYFPIKSGNNYINFHVYLFQFKCITGITSVNFF